MEPLSILGGTFSSEEADFMSHLFGNFSTKLPNSADSSAYWPHNESIMNIDEANETLENTNANMTTFLLEESSYIDGNSSALFPTSSEESYLSVLSSSGSRKGISVIPFLSATEHNDMSSNTMKRSCSLEDVQTSWKRPKFSKSQKHVSRVDIDGVDLDVVNDSNGMQEASPRPKGVAVMLNTNGKKTASSGSANDSQSVYAKKRRERINERLKILQNLVPNGTKVDISTMLAEAVEYVKFLQLQIKLLSSDDLWMYAPIAYNAMDLGLDLKLPSPR